MRCPKSRFPIRIIVFDELKLIIFVSQGLTLSTASLVLLSKNLYWYTRCCTTRFTQNMSLLIHKCNFKFKTLIDSQQSFQFVFHFPVVWYPDDWDEGHHTEPDQGNVEWVVDFQHGWDYADEKSRHGGEAKGKEPCRIWDVFLNYGVLIKLFPRYITFVTHRMIL